jgi:DeoR/GlpR family transcriptional regulator of sugar metabolism
MFDLERQQKIVNIIEKRIRVRVSELSEMLGVSEATVRRDLDKLHNRGLVQRIHGGALISEKNSSGLPVLARKTEMAAEKERIGCLAASLIQDGETIFIGSGTTTLEVVRNLIGRKNLIVITNALTVINVLAQQDEIELITTGGMLRFSELSFVGHLAEQALHELRPQKVIIGIPAISPEYGLTGDFLPEVSTDRFIIHSAPEVILVADHTKFGKIATAFIAPVTAVHKLITDKDIPEKTLENLRALGLEVYLA